MKRRLFAFTILFVLLFNLKVWAANEPAVEAKLNGTVRTGNTIEIYIDVNNINRFYAGFLEYNYDNSIIEVLEVIPGDLIKKEGISKMEFGGDAKKSPGKINYYFTCTGQVDGFSGSGRFVTVKAKVLKNGILNINSIPFSQSTDGTNNLKLQLCERTPSNEIKELNYSFKGFSTSSTSNGSGTGIGAGASTGNGTGSGDKLSGKETAGSSNVLSESASKDKEVTTDNASKENQGSNLAEDKNKTEHRDDSNALDKEKNQEDKNSKDANGITSKNENKSNLMVIIVLLCLIIIGAGAYIFYKRNHKKTP